MKWVIWNKTQDKFWKEDEHGRGDWANRYYAKKYTLAELEEKLKLTWFDGSGDLVLAVIAVCV
jgi:hypothetical protein